MEVLFNVECKDLMPEKTTDASYPQHQEMRGEILNIWAKDKNINNLWKNLAK